MAGNNKKPSRFTMGLKKKTYKGQDYYSWEGWFKGTKKSIVVSIPCDDQGRVKYYEAKDGTPLMIGGINIVDSYNPQQDNRRNF